MLDSGCCTFYGVHWEGEGEPPPKRTLSYLFEACFEERTAGVTRHYAAAQAGQRIDRLIRIWRAPVSVQNICVIDGVEYEIRQNQYTKDEDGLLVNDLALEEGVCGHGEYPRG